MHGVQQRACSCALADCGAWHCAAKGGACGGMPLQGGASAGNGVQLARVACRWHVLASLRCQSFDPPPHTHPTHPTPPPTPPPPPTPTHTLTHTHPHTTHTHTPPPTPPHGRHARLWHSPELRLVRRRGTAVGRRRCVQGQSEGAGPTPCGLRQCSSPQRMTQQQQPLHYLSRPLAPRRLPHLKLPVPSCSSTLVPANAPCRPPCLPCLPTPGTLLPRSAKRLSGIPACGRCQVSLGSAVAAAPGNQLPCGCKCTQGAPPGCP